MVTPAIGWAIVLPYSYKPLLFDIQDTSGFTPYVLSFT